MDIANKVCGNDDREGGGKERNLKEKEWRMLPNLVGKEGGEKKGEG